METTTIQAVYDALKNLAGQTIQLRSHRTNDTIYIDLLEWREVRYAVAKNDALTFDLDRTSFALLNDFKGTTTVDEIINKMNQLRYFKIANILA